MHTVLNLAVTMQVNLQQLADHFIDASDLIQNKS